MTSARPPEIPGFTFVEPIGTGGFADVFLYRQQLPARQVAVKVLRESTNQVGHEHQVSTSHGLRFGNAVLVASDAPLDVDGIRAGLARDPSRGALVTDVDPIVDGARPVVDGDELWSPVPDLPDLVGARRMGEAARRMGDTLRSALPRDS